MFQAFVITLREGLEAFLIVAISLAYLRKSGRHQLVPAVHWGIAVSLVVSIGAAIVTSRIVLMWRHAKRLMREIETKHESSAVRTCAKGFADVFLFTLLMITREGMETDMLMGTLLFQIRAVEIIAGAVAGTI